MNLDRLDFVDRNDVSRAPRPSAPRAKITPAQHISQVPVIRDADEIDERRQRERPQGRNPPAGAEENRGCQRANDRAFDRAPPDRETRDAPPLSPSGPFRPSCRAGVEIRKKDREQRVNGAAARYRQQNVSARIVIMFVAVVARRVGAQSRQAEQAAEQFLFDLQNLNAAPWQTARAPCEQSVAAMQVLTAEREREAVESDDCDGGRKDHADQYDRQRDG